MNTMTGDALREDARARLRAHVMASVAKSGSGAILVSAATVADLFTDYEAALAAADAGAVEPKRDATYPLGMVLDPAKVAVLTAAAPAPHFRLNVHGHPVPCKPNEPGALPVHASRPAPEPAAQGVMVPREFLRQVYGMAAEGCEAPAAAYRWCERIDELFHAGAASDEYSDYARDLPEAIAAAQARGDGMGVE